MEAIKMFEDIDLHRRRFFGTAAMSIAAAQLILSDSAHAQPSKGKPAELPNINARTNTSFGPLKQIDAGLLNIGYAEAGPADGPAVILLHGWPYDIYSYVDVAPLLASAGYRVIVPYLRGYGTTRFLSGETVRNGQPSVVAVDIIALMDALGMEKATLAGFDWGARTANIIAALWPERCKAMVSVSGYLIGSQESGKMPLPPTAELQWWYQFYFATERGRKRLAESPVVAVPTITLEGDANGAPHPDASSYARKFSGKYTHRVIQGGIGHNLPQEAPQAFAQAVVDVAKS
jgi:pimeloyl-ACP methyl ester carboxylesterase